MPKLIPTIFSAGNNQKIKIRNTRICAPSRTNVRTVMPSPPTVSWGTSNTITGRFWPATDQGSGSSGGNVTGTYYNYTRAGGIVSGGTSYPYYLFSGATSVNYGGGVLSYNAMSISFIYTGTAFSVYMQAFGQNLLVKIDDQYVTMTPQVFANDNSSHYGSYTFAAAGRHRIELIFTAGSHACFGGIYTAATDTLQPAAIRGPRAIIVGDSFAEASLATSGAASNFPIVFGDLMGWDDVWGSGVGSTGYLTVSGSRGTYRSRLATDVIPYAPDIVMFTGSVNDSAFTPAQIAAEATLCFQQIQAALPNALIICCSPFLKTGASYAASFLLNVRPLLKNAVQTLGGIFIDLQQMPLPSFITPQVTTLAASSSAGVSSLSTTAPLRAGSDYQFADGSQFYCTSSSGAGPYPATIDNSANAQASGATITQVGSCLWHGNGHVGATTGVGNCDIFVGSDGTHPTQAGHEAIAEAIAYGFLNQLYSN